jgi:hypothetical protein
MNIQARAVCLGQLKKTMASTETMDSQAEITPTVIRLHISISFQYDFIPVT